MPGVDPHQIRIFFNHPPNLPDFASSFSEPICYFSSCEVLQQGVPHLHLVWVKNLHRLWVCCLTHGAFSRDARAAKCNLSASQQQTITKYSLAIPTAKSHFLLLHNSYFNQILTNSTGGKLVTNSRQKRIGHKSDVAAPSQSILPLVRLLLISDRLNRFCS